MSRRYLTFPVGMVKNSGEVLSLPGDSPVTPGERAEEEEVVMSTGPTGQSQTPETKPGKWWCNFCDLRTDDQEYYLSHSCQEELKKRGAAAPAEKSDHCR